MKIIVLIMLLLPAFICPACAEGISDEAEQLTDIYSVEEALPERERKISGEFKTDGSYDSLGALGRLWQSIVGQAEETLKNELGFALQLLAAAFFCALGRALCPEGRISEYIGVAGVCAAAYIISGSFEGIISEAMNAVIRLSDYSHAAMPAIFTAAAACGAISSASVKYAGACLAMDVFMTASGEMIIPLISAYTALSLSSALFNNSILTAVSKFCKTAAVMLMSGISIAFSGYIGLSGLIAGSTDALAVKTAKTVISNSLPVVGGIISDAASVVLSSAALIKNSAGVFSLIAVCAICAGPFAVLSVKMLLYKAVSAAADMLPGSRMSALLSSMGTAMALLMGLVGSCGIMLFISIMSGIRAVSI